MSFCIGFALGFLVGNALMWKLRPKFSAYIKGFQVPDNEQTKNKKL